MAGAATAPAGPNRRARPRGAGQRSGPEERARGAAQRRGERLRAGACVRRGERREKRRSEVIDAAIVTREAGTGHGGKGGGGGALEWR